MKRPWRRLAVRAIGGWLDLRGPRRYRSATSGDLADAAVGAPNWGLFVVGVMALVYGAGEVRAIM